MLSKRAKVCFCTRLFSFQLLCGPSDAETDWKIQIRARVQCCSVSETRLRMLLSNPTDGLVTQQQLPSFLDETEDTTSTLTPPTLRGVGGVRVPKVWTRTWVFVLQMKPALMWVVVRVQQLLLCPPQWCFWPPAILSRLCKANCRRRTRVWLPSRKGSRPTPNPPPPTPEPPRRRQPPPQTRPPPPTPPSSRSWSRSRPPSPSPPQSRWPSIRSRPSTRTPSTLWWSSCDRRRLPLRDWSRSSSSERWTPQTATRPSSEGGGGLSLSRPLRNRSWRATAQMTTETRKEEVVTF